MSMSRRELIAFLRNVLAGAGAYPLLSSIASAQQQERPPADAHFFVFVELMGGTHHLLTTNYPDPKAVSAVAKDNPQAVMRFEHGKNPNDSTGRFISFTQDPALERYHQAFRNLQGMAAVEDGVVYDNDIYRNFGYFTALPYNKDNPEGFHVSTQNPERRLGLAGLPLVGQIDILSVVRSVHMQSVGHRISTRELYSGSGRMKGDHIAEVVGRHTSRDTILPFLYMSGSSSSKVIRKGIFWREFAKSLLDPKAGRMLSSVMKVSDGMRNDFSLSESQLKILDRYLETLPGVAAVSSKVGQTFKGEDFQGVGDDIKAQLDLCLKVFTTNLTRTIAIGVGADCVGLGNFDTHGAGLYHTIERSHVHCLKRAMQGLSDSVEMLQKTPYPGDPTNKKWSDVVTLVVSSEFGRPPNFAGGGEGNNGGFPGNGHYHPNNNYILFGKNVATGVWLGKSDPVTLFPYVVDFTKLRQVDFTASQQGNLADVFIDPLTAGCRAPGKLPDFKPGFAGSNSFVDVPHEIGTQHRTFMPKDIVRTIAAIAGIDDHKFREYYEDKHYSDAQVITPLVSTS